MVQTSWGNCRCWGWPVLEGPAKEVYFSQEHHLRELAHSNFARMNTLDITTKSEPFDHIVYHFVLTYSNWEDGTICYSGSFESLSKWLQNALWRLETLEAVTIHVVSVYTTPAAVYWYRIY